MNHTLSEVSFDSHGTRIRAAHFVPAQSALRSTAGVPCVVMAHGLGGTRAARLEAFAARFADAGLHALVFDYRHFGLSDGEPRQWFSVRRQLDDWAAAIAHARQLPGVDPARIALWGSSFSGGHVIAAAVADGKVAAVSAQGPMMDGRAAFLNVMRYAGVGYALRISGHALLDAAGALCGRRHLIPIIGKPGEIATMSTADAEPGYRAIVPPDWSNRITAAWMLGLPLYRPVSLAHRLPCPTLICICTRDSVAPAAAAEETARRGGARVEVQRYPIGHFDIYVGAGFEQAVRDQTTFFTRTLKTAHA